MEFTRLTCFNNSTEGITMSDSDFEKKLEEIIETLEKDLFFNVLCRNMQSVVREYTEFLSRYFLEGASAHFEQNPDKKTYKIELRFWGGIANALFSFFELSKPLQIELEDAWGELFPQGKVKVKIKYEDGECIIKCKFKIK